MSARHQQQRDPAGGQREAEQQVLPVTWLDRVLGLPAWVRTNWRLSVLIGSVVFVVLAIGAFAGWRYTAWRIETRDLRVAAFEAYDAGQFEESAGLFTSYIARRPEDASALYRLALARLETSEANQSDLVEASAALQQVLELEPTNYAAQRSLAQLYLRMGFAEEAEELAKALFSAFPRDTFSFSVLTQMQLGRDEHDAAIQLAEQVLSGELVPDQLRDAAMLVKARAYLRQGELEEALFWAEECVKVSASNLQAQELYLQLAQRLERSPEDFARHAQRLYEQHPDVVINRVMLAAAKNAAARRTAANEQLEEAKRFRDEALQLLRSTAQFELNEVELRLVLQQFERIKAETDVLAVLEGQLGQNNAPWLLREFGRRAVLSERQGKLIEHTQGLDPSDPGVSADVLGLRALALAQVDRRDEARVVVDALAARTNDPIAQGWGQVLHGIGLRTQRAERSVAERLAVFEAALRADGTNAFFHVMRGKLLQATGAKIAARTAFTQASRWSPYWAEPAVELARSYLVDGDAGAAFSWLIQAARLRPNDAGLQRLFYEAAVRNPDRLPASETARLRDNLRDRLEQEPRVVSQLVRAELALGRAEEANALIDEAARAEPLLPADVLRDLAAISVDRRMPAAENAVSAMIGRGTPGPDEARIEFTWLVPEVGFDQAYEVLLARQQQATDRDEPGWALLRAQALERSGRPEAVYVYGEVSEEFADRADVQLRVLRSERVWGERQLLDRVIERARAALEPGSEALVLVDARYRLYYTNDRDQWRAGLESLVRLTRSNPDHVPIEAREMLARAAVVFNLLEIELEQYEMIRRRDPSNLVPVLAMSHRLRQLGQIENADRLLARTIERGALTGYADARAIASHYLSVGRVDEGLRAFETHYLNAGNATPPDLLLGTLYARAGRVRRAGAIASALLALETPQGTREAAELYRLMGDSQGLADAARQAELADGWTDDQRSVVRFRIAELRGDGQAALGHLREAVRAAPERVNLRLRLIGGLIESGRALEAVQVAEASPVPDFRFRAVAGRPELMAAAVRDPIALPILNDLGLNRVDVDANLQTLELLKTAMEASPDERAAAIDALVRQVDRFPLRLQAQLAVLRWLARTDRYEELAERAQGLMLMFPQTTAPAEIAARVLARAGRSSEAKELAQAWRNRLLDAWPAERLLITLIAVGEPESLPERLAGYMRRVERAPDADPRVTRAVVTALLRAKRVNEAIAIFSASAGQSDLWASAWPSLAPALGGDRLLTRQWIDAASAVAGDATDEEVKTVQAKAWFTVGSRTRDNAALQTARALIRPLAEGRGAKLVHLDLLGNVSLELGDLDTAKAAYDTLLARSPRHVSGLNNLAMVLLTMNRDLERAEALATQASSLRPEVPAIEDTLARVIAARGRPAEALIHIDRAVAGRPDVVDWQIFRAELLVLMGREQAARDAVATIRQRFVTADLESGEVQRLRVLETQLGT